jgi:predicted Zn-dependent peptidase
MRWSPGLKNRVVPELASYVRLETRLFNTRRVESRLVSVHTLPNGLTVLTAPNARANGVTVEVFLPVGALTDPLEGSASVLEEWLWRGAGSRGSRALEDALDDLGVVRESEVGLEGLLLSFSALPGDLDVVLGTVADLVLRPRLEAREFAGAHAQALAAREALEDAPDSVLFTALSRAYWTSAHGRSPFGTFSDLARVTPRNARADWRRRAVPGGAVVAVSGALETEAFVRLIEGHFGAWNSGTPVPEPPLESRHGFVEHVQADVAQTQIALICPSPALCAPGYYESRFALEVLGTAQANRLFQAVREDRGLAYSVSASTTFLRDHSSLEVYAATTPERAEDTVGVLVAELERLSDGITGNEFARARVGLLTNLALFEEASSAHASAMVRDWRLLGRLRPAQEVRHAVESVTLEGVNAWLATRPYRVAGAVTLGVRAPQLDSPQITVLD